MTEQVTTGCPENVELMAWLDKEVGGARAAEISAHVVGCPDCTTEVQRFVAASAAVRQWRIDPLPAKQMARPKRKLAWLVAAAVVLVGLLSTVRVQCAEEPTCEHKRLGFSFLPTNIRQSDIPRPQPALPPSAYQNVSGSSASRFERDWNARRRLQTGVPQGSAKVVVVMFIDWQCPACRAVHKSYLPMIDSFNKTLPGSIKVVMRDYPLNIRCNPNVPVEMHPAACEAAVAVRLAREKNRETEMVEWLFARQQSLTPALVRQGAKDIAGVTNLAARYPAVIKDVAAEVELARRLEVGSTPTVFVNGVLARTPDNSLFSPAQFRMALEVELAKK
jgi:protein-disulfide isomerase